MASKILLIYRYRFIERKACLKNNFQYGGQTISISKIYTEKRILRKSPEKMRWMRIWCGWQLWNKIPGDIQVEHWTLNIYTNWITKRRRKKTEEKKVKGKQRKRERWIKCWWRADCRLLLTLFIWYSMECEHSVEWTLFRNNVKIIVSKFLKWNRHEILGKEFSFFFGEKCPSWMWCNEN